MAATGPLTKLTSRQRLVLAVMVMIGMWAVAWACVVIGLVAPMSDFDTGGDSGERLGMAAFTVAAVSFPASGPVAYWICRRWWVLAAPVGLIVASALAVGVAAIT